MPGTVGIYAVTFQLSETQPPDNDTQVTIAQSTFVSNVVTFAVGQQPANLAAAILATPAAAARRPGAREGRL